MSNSGGIFSVRKCFPPRLRFCLGCNSANRLAYGLTGYWSTHHTAAAAKRAYHFYFHFSPILSYVIRRRPNHTACQRQVFRFNPFYTAMITRDHCELNDCECNIMIVVVLWAICAWSCCVFRLLVQRAYSLLCQLHRWMWSTGEGATPPHHHRCCDGEWGRVHLQSLAAFITITTTSNARARTAFINLRSQTNKCSFLFSTLFFFTFYGTDDLKRPTLRLPPHTI